LPADSGSTEEDIRYWLRARRESTQYLTNGRQHALDLINGHNIGLASNAEKTIEVEPAIEMDELSEALDNLPRSRRAPSSGRR